MRHATLTNGLLAIIAFALLAIASVQLGLIQSAVADTHSPIKTSYQSGPIEVVIVGLEPWADNVSDDKKLPGALPVKVIR
jgi:hypothetical protein